MLRPALNSNMNHCNIRLTGASPAKLMVDWEITATTIYCEAVKDEVTLLVSADGTCRCTGRQKHARPGGTSGCPPAECDIMVSYREKLLGEEDSGR
jgi:hypothetical protein